MDKQEEGAEEQRKDRAEEAAEVCGRVTGKVPLKRTHQSARMLEAICAGEVGSTPVVGSLEIVLFVSITRRSPGEGRCPDVTPRDQERCFRELRAGRMTTR
jgi:hypothetical protein